MMGMYPPLGTCSISLFSPPVIIPKQHEPKQLSAKTSLISSHLIILVSAVETRLTCGEKKREESENLLHTKISFPPFQFESVIHGRCYIHLNGVWCKKRRSSVTSTLSNYNCIATYRPHQDSALKRVNWNQTDHLYSVLTLFSSFSWCTISIQEEISKTQLFITSSPHLVFLQKIIWNLVAARLL